MTINRDLAEKQGLSEREIIAIEEIHTQLSKLLSKANLGVFNTSIYNAIEQLEFQAQDLWGFSQDPGFHTWKKLYEFRCQWVGRTFKCNITGIEVSIPEYVMERDFISVGKGFVDVGRLNMYARFSGVTEIKGEPK